MAEKRVISSATSDLFSDQRLHRTAMYLKQSGVNVLLVGREKRNSPTLEEREYDTFRIKPWSQKGPFFYLEFNIRLFLKLLFIKADEFLANDLDTLPANALAGILRRIPVVYDIHEYYTEVPELVNRKWTRKFWLTLEKIFFKIPRKHFTVSQSIAIALQERYHVKIDLVRNFPLLNKNESSELTLEEPKIILYQGSVNVSRGLEEMIDAMEFLPDCKLKIVGEGDVLEELKNRVGKCSWQKRIEFLGRIPFNKLSSITETAHLGISIEKRDGQSYEYALPNKFFDYMQAGLPSMISSLPEMLRINDKFKVAVVTPNHEPKTIANTVLNLFKDKNLYWELKSNCKKAAAELNWEKESLKLDSIFDLTSDPVL